MTTLPDGTFDLVLRGRLDQPLLALVAEYGLATLPAQVIVRGLPGNLSTLDALLLRAQALGVNVVRVRRGDPDR
jgi:hypothetical protein